MDSLDSGLFRILNYVSVMKELKNIRDLRLDDPLASFLFLMGDRDLFISLQFADGEALIQNVLSLKVVLVKCFEIIFGLKVNFHKAKLTVITVSNETLQRLAVILNCRLMSMFRWGNLKFKEILNFNNFKYFNWNYFIFKILCLDKKN